MTFDFITIFNFIFLRTKTSLILLSQSSCQNQLAEDNNELLVDNSTPFDCQSDQIIITSIG